VLCKKNSKKERGLLTLKRGERSIKERHQLRNQRIRGFIEDGTSDKNRTRGKRMETLSFLLNKKPEIFVLYAWGESQGGAQDEEKPKEKHSQRVGGGGERFQMLPAGECWVGKRP